MKPCECACGEMIPEKDKQYRKMRFKAGHQNRKAESPLLKETKECECGCGSIIKAFNRDMKSVRFRTGHKAPKIVENPLVTCLCGCSEEFPKYDSRNRERFFTKGHAGRVETEQRICICGCGESFICKVNAITKYKRFHQNKLNIVNLSEEKKASYRKKLSEISTGKMPKNFKSFYEKGLKVRLSNPMVGDKNPMWKGGVTSKNMILRDKFAKTIGPKVMERDNFTCQLCSQYGGQLHVDHILSWAEYPDSRFDINNCRTLCVPCHYFVTFGKDMPSTSTWGLRAIDRSMHVV